MTWNTPKPGEWNSEELSQGRIIDYARAVTMLRPGHLMQEFLIHPSWKNRLWQTWPNPMFKD